MKTQKGGTGLGFVVGLLVGLAVALAVAVYVTKVPVPLVDRGLGRKAGQDVQEQERNKDWNPNAGLAGKTVPAAKPADESAAGPAASVAEPGKAAPTAAARPAARDPVAELIKSREGEPASAADADPFNYFVQAGAFQSPAEAEAQRARLAMLGFDPKVSEREQAGQLVHRVRLGPYRSKVDAERAQEQLTAQGVKAALIRVQR